MSDKINVAVRVRPFNKREIDLGTESIVSIKENQVVINRPPNDEKENSKQSKAFKFDYCFNSLDPSDKFRFDGQEEVFNSLGKDILDNAFIGYNACIFAYGQTGSGKSYTMMGSKEVSEGIIPRLCNSLFERISDKSCPSWTAKVEVSYMEIYNEKVYDLLNPSSTSLKHGLKVREHNVLGPYVDGLSQLAVSSYREIDLLMVEGNKSRTVASTNMNNESSRSHAVFTVILTQTLTDLKSQVSGEKVSKISLVDLAGSERAIKTGAVGERLKEGSNINKSLTTLGLVISKLADQNLGKTDKFVPYRDSILTWLLKDNLGGNSKTVMVATISPSADNYEETLSTLRYADRAKRIVNHAIVNEDPNARIIRELRAEVDALKEMLKHATQPDVLKEKLSENEKLMKEMSLTWEEKLFITGQTQEDRHQAFEKLGISVARNNSENEYFLVNLNSDPSLNEKLNYYLKESLTSVGCKGDIQLNGVGIQENHCRFVIENSRVYLIPWIGAKTCVNGIEIEEKTALENGDRILLGSNHFFRLNCPKIINSKSPDHNFDWKMAQEEVMKGDYKYDVLQHAINKLEKQYEEDKQIALQKQKIEYEMQFKALKNNYLSPSNPYPSLVRSHSNYKVSSSAMISKLEKWEKDRDEVFKRSLAKLREDIIRANGLAREANYFAEEITQKSSTFSVTLQIPPNNLTPNRRRGAFISEPAILVKRKEKSNQIWSLEKMELKLIDMRELYDEIKKDTQYSFSHLTSDPFYEVTESHHLIGVANIYLNVLFHDDLCLDYYTPIISQQGETSGRLQIQIQKSFGSFPQDRVGQCTESLMEPCYETLMRSNNNNDANIGLRITIKQAVGLPPSMSHYVFCQYSIWGNCDLVVVPPVIGPHLSSTHFTFNHSREFTIPLSEEFIEFCSEGALSIEIYGHRSAGFVTPQSIIDPETQRAKARSLADRWSELTKKLELSVEVQELSDGGDYVSVEVQPRNDVGTGGVFQFRQGQQRRIICVVRPVPNSGTLPLIVESLSDIAIGAPCVRSKLQKPLDSYQDEDLNRLRSRWSEALTRRKDYLDAQIQKYMSKVDKTESEMEREQTLVDQWVCLTEERNSVMVPASGSGVPGAPADWEPPEGMETHSPVLFLDLNADDLSTGYSESDDVIMIGGNSILPKEHGGHFFHLPIIRYLESEIGGVSMWDSSIHESLCLNRVTPNNERAYLIVKATVRLSHPNIMDLELRKRICFNVYKRQSITDKIRRKIGQASPLKSLQVVYELVSNIPKASEELENRESLAVMAASGQEHESSDGETFIEKYTRGISAVETILVLDRLRQNVALKELIQSKSNSRSLSRIMRKTVSVPNISHAMSHSFSLDSLSNYSRMKMSDSFCDLILESDERKNTLDPQLETVPEVEVGNEALRPTSLNIIFNSNKIANNNNGRLSSKTCTNFQSKGESRMTTVHEDHKEGDFNSLN